MGDADVAEAMDTTRHTHRYTTHHTHTGTRLGRTAAKTSLCVPMCVCVYDVMGQWWYVLACKRGIALPQDMHSTHYR